MDELGAKLTSGYRRHMQGLWTWLLFCKAWRAAEAEREVLAALSGQGTASSSSAARVHCGNEGTCATARIRQRTARGSVSPAVRQRLLREWEKDVAASSSEASVEDELDGLDEVAVEFYSEEPVKTIRFSLPEMQDCAAKEIGGDAADGSESRGGQYCTGYMFDEASNRQGCILLRTEAGAGTSSMDLVAGGAVERCLVYNQRSLTMQGSDPQLAGQLPSKSEPDAVASAPERALAVVTLASVGSEGRTGWQQFSIRIRSPRTTPQGKDALGIESNTFLLALEAEDGRKLTSIVYRAEPLKALWACSYTGWQRLAKCSARCGGGERYSMRSLRNPPPADIDPRLLINCQKPLSRTEPCNEFPCDADCQLGSWTRWADGPCSAPCGGGWEVQRRFVVHGPLGNGLSCEAWSSGARVRYRPCNEQPCQQERCNLVSTDGKPVSLMMACSEFCGTGVQHMAELVDFKDGPLTPKRSTCGAWHTEECGGAKASCRRLEFAPAVPGDVPALGKHFDLVVAFSPEEAADLVELVAPLGFHIESVFDASNDFHACYLTEHNIPTMSRCEVRFEKQKPTKLHITFTNPLEPLQLLENGEPYRLRFWVRHPKQCADGSSTDGICLGKWKWQLLTWSRGPAARWESTTGGYSVYVNAEAAEEADREMHMLESSRSSGAVATRETSTPAAGAAADSSLASASSATGAADVAEAAKSKALSSESAAARRGADANASLLESSRERSIRSAESKDAVPPAHYWHRDHAPQPMQRARHAASARPARSRDHGAVATRSPQDRLAATGSSLPLSGDV
eukprot:TRINITY_DN43334_c0_g2_i1.p1 TRINITY_DN43334_c0_g2~~TRINITY_DN43334_c0_g2_i1.p1  ORF type:complete len:800 (-),score=155.57 TRINITY_DN43334_c0_g2_i1:69-2468(-)